MVSVGSRVLHNRCHCSLIGGKIVGFRGNREAMSQPTRLCFPVGIKWEVALVSTNLVFKPVQYTMAVLYYIRYS